MDRQSMTGDDRRSMAGGESETLSLRSDPAPSRRASDIRIICNYPGCSERSEAESVFCEDHPGGLDITPSRPPDDSVGVAVPLGSDGGEIEQLRRDVSRLEGKVDALLAALEVEDADD